MFLSFLLLSGLNLAKAQGASSQSVLNPAPLSQSQPTAKTPPASSSNGEDWSAIELSKSGLSLDSIGGMLISKTDLPGCTRELLRMQWRPNDPIDLYITRPLGTNKFPVVLFLYNYNVDTDVFREDRWCDRAVRNGFAVVGFPSALSWQRLHAPRPLKEWFVSDLQEALATSTHDTQMVLNYLATRDDLDVHRVAIFGQGSGGAIAILTAAADPRIVALDLMDPWGDWPDWLRGSRQIPEEERPTYIEPAFLQQVSNLDPLTYLPRLKGRSIRIYQTDDDLVTPALAREKMAAAGSLVGEVMHYPNMSAEAKALGADGIVSWLGAQVANR